jgi:hypothetical protein
MQTSSGGVASPGHGDGDRSLQEAALARVVEGERVRVNVGLERFPDQRGVLGSGDIVEALHLGLDVGVPSTLEPAECRRRR